MTNSTNGLKRGIKVKGQNLGTISSFKYLGVVNFSWCSKPDFLSRIAQATALTKLKPVWRDNGISLESKMKLLRYLVITIFQYACKSCTLTVEMKKRRQAFEMRCYRRLLNISYNDLVIDAEIPNKIPAACRKTTFWPRLNVFWFSKANPTWHSERKRGRGSQKKRWKNSIKELT